MLISSHYAADSQNKEKQIVLCVRKEGGYFAIDGFLPLEAILSSLFMCV